MLFTLVMPVVVLLIFRFTPGKSDNPGGIFAHASDLAFPVGAGYALLMLVESGLQQFWSRCGGHSVFLCFAGAISRNSAGEKFGGGVRAGRGNRFGMARNVV